MYIENDHSKESGSKLHQRWPEPRSRVKTAVTTGCHWAFKNKKVKAQESNDEDGWSTLIGRGLLMLCSDWMDLSDTDASSLMP